MSSSSEDRHRTVHPLQTSPRPTRKPLGELAELAFMSKAASLGFGVAKPYRDSERFDFILRWDHRLWRVQVKSTRTAHRRVYEIGAHVCSGGVDTYTKNEIDLIVAYLAYVLPEDTLCVFPIEATRGRKRLCLHPNVPRKECYKYEKYREAWWLMKSTDKSHAANKSQRRFGME
jgi:hypothetical protein